MATHAYIIAAEDQLKIMTDDDVDHVIGAYRREGVADGTGRPYPENRDLWGTLYVNACNAVRDNPALRPLVDLLEVEFG